MRKSTVISLIALLVSMIGLLVALIAYFKRRTCALCDDLDDELTEYCDDDDCDGCSAEFKVVDCEDEDEDEEDPVEE